MEEETEERRADLSQTSLTAPDILSVIQNVALPGKDAAKKWDVHLQDGRVDRILEHHGREDDNDYRTADKHDDARTVNGRGALLAPSLCHPHIHLDKAFLLSHPRYAHLQIESGGFQEAMSLTGEAKLLFGRADLLERGQRVIGESAVAGVTHMRAFVEVDAGVMTKCLEAGLALKQRALAERQCNVQLCAFAQLPLFSLSQGDEDGGIIRELMRRAAADRGIDVVGSTPYVESDWGKMQKNVAWMIDLSIEFGKHLDFHLDYNLDAKTEAMVWSLVDVLREKRWVERTNSKTIVLGHCTRLTLLNNKDWQNLATEIEEAGLPISFVGLPTSDLFMMRTGQRPEVRGTLDVPHLIKQYGLNACVGVNNIGNAFTPQGSCDPLGLASQGVAIYQAGTVEDTKLLYECVSTRARAAIGYGREHAQDFRLEIQPGDAADFVLFQGATTENCDWLVRKSVSDAVYLYDRCHGRRAIWGGRLTG